jgi:flagellar basal body-associated protein FliL
MKKINKKGAELTINIIIIIMIVVIVAIIVLVWFNSGIRAGSNTTSTLVKCESQGIGAGCFDEMTAEEKQDNGFSCTRGTLGCDQEKYCCVKLF